MSHLAQCFEGGGRNARLDNDSAPELLAIGKTRFFHGSLDIHMVIDDVRHKLRVSERLIEAAHDAETDVLGTSLHKPWNDRVERTLTAGEGIGRCRIQREEASAVLEGESHSQYCYVRSKVVVVALNDGKDIALAIDDCEVRGI